MHVFSPSTFMGDKMENDLKAFGHIRAEKPSTEESELGSFLSVGPKITLEHVGHRALKSTLVRK